MFVDKKILKKGEALGELLIRPFQAFASREASGGALLVLVAAIAVIWVNSSYGYLYEELWRTITGINISHVRFEKSLHFWINDGIMTIFFFVVGLEIKRELLVGELASLKQAILPMVAAAGGMIVPAAIYHFFNMGTPEEKGWGIPMATDIAFTLGALKLLGKRVPRALVVYIVALAIVDDLGAVLVIAAFYTSAISMHYLAMSGLIVILLIGINFLGYRNPIPYVLLGVLLWHMVYLSGVHSTIAGVILAITIPARSKVDTDEFLSRAENVLNEFECAGGACGYSVYTNADHQAAVHTLESMAHKVMPPLIRLEYLLHPWVVFLIVPLFALANAGVHLEWSKFGTTLMSPISLGIILGLFVGKQIGIFGASWLAVKSRLADMPRGATMAQMYGGAILCGIGFTMSLYIDVLVFHNVPPVLDAGKISVFVGSLLSFAVGTIVLILATMGGTKQESGASNMRSTQKVS